jgi:hypothetical protein
MAIYKLFPTKDATIYSRYPKKNTGLDSILEANADYSTGVAHVSRYLIQFDQSEIDSLIDNKIGNATYQVNLKNYICNLNNLNVDTTLEVFAISGSWGMGTGHFNDDPITTNGCNWKYKTYEGVNAWNTSNFSDYVTASWGTVAGGGTWYSGSNLGYNVALDKTYSYSSIKDLDVNVTGIIRTWYSASNNLEGDISTPFELPIELGIPPFFNDGFIVKQSKADEFIASLNKQAKLQFYSVDTNTIYPPELQFKWDDYISASSPDIPTIDTTELVTSLDNNPGTFRNDSVHKFRVNCRPQFPTRTYTTSSYFTQRNYLPTSSYYAVKDLDTNEFVINFDDIYTKISADTKSNYFTLYMNGLEPERYYKLLFKIVLDGETVILDDNYYFKIING